MVGKWHGWNMKSMAKNKTKTNKIYIYSYDWNSFRQWVSIIVGGWHDINSFCRADSRFTLFHNNIQQHISPSPSRPPLFLGHFPFPLHLPHLVMSSTALAHPLCPHTTEEDHLSAGPLLGSEVYVKTNPPVGSGQKSAGSYLKTCR